MHPGFFVFWMQNGVSNHGKNVFDLANGDSVFIIGIFQDILHHQKGLVLLVLALVARNTLLHFLLCHAVTSTMVCR